MTDPVDPQHRRRPAFDKDSGKFGQGYTLDDERRLGDEMPAGSVAPKPSQVPEGTTDAGRRASFDPETGEVRGSGSSAGGGHDGEDPDADSAGGHGAPLTGKGSDHHD
ncbi:hypothetical protein J2Y58_002691 [Sphingomonas sp. BE138]|uniref:hypothetical protein n=1 Tax=Sphingomonas sp. BE138 TaxID=2817845 RepID=UPI0028579A95|nr:hypothetical protein [Sphingomonas sp. BE138]MDR6789320.1 hypothetical protein [Sphingomonas sp. BE138]